MIKFTWSFLAKYYILARLSFFSSALMTCARANKFMYLYGCKAPKIMVRTDEGE